MTVIEMERDTPNEKILNSLEHTELNAYSMFVGIPNKLIVLGSMIKTFASETEEADWWEAHDDELADALMKAEAADDLGSGLHTTAADFAIHIRLDPEDIDKARVQAAERGLRYQTCLKMIIHEALRKAEKSQSASTS